MELLPRCWHVPFALLMLASASGAQAGLDWPSYGGDAGGARYVAQDQIHKGNLDQLAEAWTYHTGDLPESRGAYWSELHDRYGGSGEGGISPSRGSPNVLIFTDPAIGEKFGYFDGWNGSRWNRR